MFNNYFIAAAYLMDQTSCDFFLKICFKYLEAKYRTCWTVFNTCFMPGIYLMNPIPCDFFQRSVLSISKQIIGDVICHKHVKTGPYLIDQISCDFFGGFVKKSTSKIFGLLDRA